MNFVIDSLKRFTKLLDLPNSHFIRLNFPAAFLAPDTARSSSNHLRAASRSLFVATRASRALLIEVSVRFLSSPKSLIEAFGGCADE